MSIGSRGRAEDLGALGRDRFHRGGTRPFGAAAAVLFSNQEHERHPNRGEADVERGERAQRPAEPAADEDHDPRHDRADRNGDGVDAGLADELLNRRGTQKDPVRGVSWREYWNRFSANLDM